MKKLVRGKLDMVKIVMGALETTRGSLIIVTIKY